MDSTSEISLAERVRRTLEDLAVIRQTLLNISGPSGAAGNSEQPLDLELAGELKSVVDALRLLLWGYIQALSANAGRAPEEVLSWYKMELAVEMLRSVRTRPGGARGCISDFEQMVNQTLTTAAKRSRQERTQ